MGGVDPTGITVTGFCGGQGACCDIYTGICEDEVDAVVCLEQGREPHPGELCAELRPACGYPGACCHDATGECVDYVYAANCDGRHAVGQPCDPDPFEPPCYSGWLKGVLYAPAAADNPTFRSEVSAIIGRQVDYYDARAGTPTLEELMAYAAVMTWVVDQYADSQLMGDRLADYVDAHLGRVILGQWCYPGGQAFSLAGRIMEPEYCPVTGISSSYGAGSYAGDGMDCVHLASPVTAYATDYLDLVTSTTPASVTDGTFTTDTPAVIFRHDRLVYYSPGNTGGLYGTGDWVPLTANMCYLCYSYWGACCYPDAYEDPAAPWLGGICEDWVDPYDCLLSSGEPYLFEFCDDLDPICGNPGACCIDNPAAGTDPPGECTIGLEDLCSGRFLAGEVCDPDPFVPPCGEYEACEHSITMWDDYGDGWNDGYIDVYVDGELELAGLTLPSGAGPLTVTFEAGNNAEIITVWTPGGWPYEASYCIYDFLGNELGCDGMGGVDPTGITVTGFCGGLGACCVGANCVATTTPSDCDAMGGTFYAGQACPEFECPVAGAGETCENAIVVEGFAYHAEGNTCDLTDDYDEVCPHTGSTSPDVVYVYTPPSSVIAHITLCTDSDYDTKLYVYENECPPPGTGPTGTTYACNDDACSTPSYPNPHVSDLLGVPLTGGDTYYIVVDGYGGACGNYTLDIYFAVGTESPSGDQPSGEHGACPQPITM
jgi:hypothetical protein